MLLESLKTKSDLKEPCLFLHGMASNHLAIAPIKTYIEELGHPCFIPQLPGHRKTLPKDNEVNIHNWELEIDCLVRYLTHNFKTPIIVGGLSFGSILALNLAVKYGDLIKGIIVLSPPMILKNKYKDLILTLSKFVPTPLLRYFGHINKSSITSVYKESNETYSFNMLKQLSIKRSQIIRDIKNINCPIFIGQSTKDYHLHPNSSYRIKEHAINATVKIIIKDFGPFHNLSKIPESKYLIEEGLNFICQKK